TDVVRKAAFRLEQIYSAYSRYFPPRQPSAAPTHIVLYRDREGYETRLRADERAFVNNAFYDPKLRCIACLSDLDPLDEEIDRVRQQHKQLRADLDRQEAILEKLYKGNELLRHLQPIRETRRKIDPAEKLNEAGFEKATRRLFSTLFHEA